MIDVVEVRSLLAAHNQSHILQFWDNLSDIEKEELLKDIKSTNVPEATSYFQSSIATLEETKKLDDLMQPIPSHLYGAVSRTSSEDLELYENIGLESISNGQVGVLLLAGGQGTRLGVTYPKGMYDVGLPSHKSLYQIQAERIRKLCELAEERTGKYGTITWFIMTSEHTKEPTLEFFKKHNFFGLNKNDVILFEQGMLPCFTLDGKIILDNRSKISKAPDGNGGIYRALQDNGLLRVMETRGIKYLHAHSVDNILVKVADPIFIGYCIHKKADCGAKVVEKSSPTEALGVICSVNGKFQVVEYSEITLETAMKQDDDGKLTFRAGSICNHFFTTDFLRNVATKFESDLKLHIAKKKIPFVSSNGQRCIPDKPNGIKMEKFIFDAFQFSDHLVVWEVSRDEEFSALKNADSAGKDCPKTAIKALYRLHKKFLEEAGGIFDGNSDCICEISPLISYAGEGLKNIIKEKPLKSPVLLKKPNEPIIYGGIQNNHQG
nr:PREDICTED: UDP-N-acetylhexosamine pyrophosphorylase [Bemisia tabaci]